MLKTRNWYLPAFCLIVILIALSCRQNVTINDSYLNGTYTSDYKGNRIVLNLKPNHNYTWSVYSYDNESITSGVWHTPAKEIIVLSPDDKNDKESRFEIVNNGQTLIRNDNSDIDMSFNKVRR